MDAESLFIESVLISDIMPCNYDLGHAISYLEDSITNVKYREAYEIWIKIRDDIIFNLIPGKYVEIYGYNGYVAKGTIKEDELQQLKDKIVNDELSLLKRTYKIALSEYWHSMDELNDDR
ncbi:Hypothetical protein HVR_LOCUS488 [uncultured virus]|nr:Hypothetical protein HVR_LOCUS488 [uncultured virus]